MAILILPFVLLLSSVVRAANDWNTPCLTGQCSFDVTNSTARSTASGSLFIVSSAGSTHTTSGLINALYQNGSTNAISDLTPAAGWTILDCDSTTSAQDIRAICTGDNTTCSHLYQNGAVGTIVRLPENVFTFSYCSAYPVELPPYVVRYNAIRKNRFGMESRKPISPRRCGTEA